MLLSLTSQFWDLTLDKSKLIRSEHEKFFSGLISLNQHQKHQYKTEQICLFFSRIYVIGTIYPTSR